MAKFPTSVIGNKYKISQHIQKMLRLENAKNEKIVKHTAFSSEEAATDDQNLQNTFSNLPLCEKLAVKTPIFLAHSLNDKTVPFTSQGQGLPESMKILGFNVTWKQYADGGHWIHPKHGVDDMAAFLHELIDI